MSKGTNDLVDILVAKLKRRQLVGSSAVAQATLKLLIVVISKNNWSKANDLLNLVRSVGQRLIKANPTELAIGNIVRRVLHVIREEYRDAEASSKLDDNSEFQSAPLTTSSSMYNLLSETGSDDKEFTHASSNLRSDIIQEVRDIRIELDTIYENIKNQATNHIHSKYDLNEQHFIFCHFCLNRSLTLVDVFLCCNCVSQRDHYDYWSVKDCRGVFEDGI